MVCVWQLCGVYVVCGLCLLDVAFVRRVANGICVAYVANVRRLRYVAWGKWFTACVAFDVCGVWLILRKWC